MTSARALTVNVNALPALIAVVEALREARPYVYDRIDFGAQARGEADWRSQTAMEILVRVDQALAAFSFEEQA